MSTSTDERRGSGRRRLLAGLALIAVAGVVAGVVVATRSSSPPSGGGGGRGGAAGAATVERRNLVETDTESGTLSYADPQTVYNRLSGTVTWLPSVGQVVKQGEPLFDVDGKAVILMYGSAPAFRALDSSDAHGQDVLQLNRDLVSLGFDPDGIVVDDEWQAATTDGVDAWQASLSRKQTGKIALGAIVFLPGKQIIATVDGTIGSEASTAAAPASTEFVDFSNAEASSCGTGASTTTTTTASTTTTPATTTPATTTPATTTPTTTPCTTTTSSSTKPAGTKPGKHSAHHSHGSGSSTSASTLRALLALLRAEEQQLRAEQAGSNSSHGSPSSSGGNSPSSSGSDHPGSTGNGGDGGAGGGATPVAILQTTSTQLVVTVDLSASLQSEAVVGERVTVEMPSGKTVHGKVTAVSPVAQSSSDDSGDNSGAGGAGGSGGDSSSATIPVTVTLKGHQTGAGLDQAAVSVNFAEAKAFHVLSVPVTALLATPGGNYAVQEAAAPHKLIPVKTGLFAAGYVRISGSGIYPGLQVTDSQG
jgi:hypothetical protein